MTGAKITYTFDDAAWRTAVTQVSGVVLHTRILKLIAVGLVTETESRFDRGVDAWGVPWKPLNPAYAAIKRGTRILVASGFLQRGLTGQVSGNQVIVGSNREYAAVHLFGAVIKPVRAKALAFRMGKTGPRGGKGSGIVFARSVTIPARPYLGFGPRDQRVVMDVLDAAISRVFG